MLPLHQPTYEQVTRIELASSVWKTDALAVVLYLHIVGITAGARTQDSYIKSVILYQLSYGDMAERAGFEPTGLFRVRKFSRLL